MKRFDSVHKFLSAGTDILLWDLQCAANTVFFKKRKKGRSVLFTVTEDEYTEHGRFSSKRFKNRFGSWNKALAAAELEFSYDRSKANSESKRHARGKLRKRVFERDGYKCVMCGRGEKDKIRVVIDHIVPYSKGGKTVYENLQVLCDWCNYKKGAN